MPFLVRWPDRLPRSHARDALVSHIDIVPTLLTAPDCHPRHWRARAWRLFPPPEKQVQ